MEGMFLSEKITEKSNGKKEKGHSMNISVEPCEMCHKNKRQPYTGKKKKKTGTTEFESET